LIKTSSDAEALASQVPDSGSFVFVPAFNGLFAPRWRPDARGTMTGITQVSLVGSLV
jgi:glycerol kinase